MEFQKERRWFHPVPFAPGFPVYGLGPSFMDLRAIALWNLPIPQPLWQVELHHGHPDPQRGPFAVVITDSKMPTSRAGGTTGVNDAAVKALLNLEGALDDATRAATNTRALIDLGQDLDDPAWTRGVASVDGQPRAFHVHTRGELWAAAADLGEVAIGIASRGMDLHQLDLQRVNERLGEYRSSDRLE